MIEASKSVRINDCEKGSPSLWFLSPSLESEVQMPANVRGGREGKKTAFPPATRNSTFRYNTKSGRGNFRLSSSSMLVRPPNSSLQSPSWLQQAPTKKKKQVCLDFTKNQINDSKRTARTNWNLLPRAGTQENAMRSYSQYHKISKSRVGSEHGWQRRIRTRRNGQTLRCDHEIQSRSSP
jgi:hypothetical protein